jgi:hypothetical protein
MREVYPIARVDAAVLVGSPLPADGIRLREILFRGNWKLHEASDCREALALLRDESVAVQICERDHADGNWEDLLNITTSLPGPPNRFVFFRLGSEYHPAKALNPGGFDVLAQAADRRKMSEFSDLAER